MLKPGAGTLPIWINKDRFDEAANPNSKSAGSSQPHRFPLAKNISALN